MSKSLSIVVGCLLLFASSFAQTVSQKLQKAYQQFEVDSQLKHAISSLYVIDAKTGKVIFDKNSQVGLAPASTQKIITSATCFELLGKDYRYKTELGYKGKLQGNRMNGSIFIIGSGDPTFGSWRWENTGRRKILQDFTTVFKKLGIKNILGDVISVTGYYETQEIPDGWIWQDAGNYYGAGSSALNWHENQYDLFLRSGKNIGDSVKIVSANPPLHIQNFYSEVRSAAKGTGDNAYIYLPIGHSSIIVRGTIPVDEQRFKISGALPRPFFEFSSDLVAALDSSGIECYSGKWAGHEFITAEQINQDSTTKIIYTHYSPSFDSIIYWFLQKSINLYGEALIKTIAYEKKGFGSTDSGIAIVKDFWKQKGIDEEELNIADGSGLSPLNRVTTHAQVQILKYAKTRDWFPYFYDALPEYNGMKMKSGTISDVKAFCGYHKAKDGNEYIFSFLVNNYNGSSSGVVNKMYKVLNVLK